MENEIKVGEYARTFAGYIFKVLKISEEDKLIYYYGDQPEWIGEWKENIIKHSPNLIDLIECGDYVNGYKVTNVINKEPCPSGKCVDIDADRPSEYCTLWEDNIETVVTKEQFESISYKVKE